jgi:hypothetical protein
MLTSRSIVGARLDCSQRSKGLAVLRESVVVPGV